MTKRADSNKQGLSPDAPSGSKPEKPAAAPDRPAKDRDARRSDEKLHENQERLKVGEDHLTDAMRKGKRGSFP